MGGEDVECLDLFQFLYLLEAVELLLHAIDRHVFAGLEGEGGEDY